MVSPVPDERDTKRIKRFSHYGLAHQPVDLREGVAKAYTVVKEVNKPKAEINISTGVTLMGRNSIVNVYDRMVFPSTGDHRHRTDHL